MSTYNAAATAHHAAVTHHAVDSSSSVPSSISSSSTVILPPSLSAHRQSIKQNIPVVAVSLSSSNNATPANNSPPGPTPLVSLGADVSTASSSSSVSSSASSASTSSSAVEVEIQQHLLAIQKLRQIHANGSINGHTQGNGNITDTSLSSLPSSSLSPSSSSSSSSSWSAVSSPSLSRSLSGRIRGASEQVRMLRTLHSFSLTSAVLTTTGPTSPTDPHSIHTTHTLCTQQTAEDNTHNTLIHTHTQSSQQHSDKHAAPSTAPPPPHAPSEQSAASAPSLSATDIRKHINGGKEEEEQEEEEEEEEEEESRSSSSSVISPLLAASAAAFSSPPVTRNRSAGMSTLNTHSHNTSSSLPVQPSFTSPKAKKSSSAHRSPFSVIISPAKDRTPSPEKRKRALQQQQQEEEDRQQNKQTEEEDNVVMFQHDPDAEDEEDPVAAEEDDDADDGPAPEEEAVDVVLSEEEEEGIEEQQQQEDEEDEVPMIDIPPAPARVEEEEEEEEEESVEEDSSSSSLDYHSALAVAVAEVDGIGGPIIRPDNNTLTPKPSISAETAPGTTSTHASPAAAADTAAAFTSPSASITSATSSSSSSSSSHLRPFFRSRPSALSPSYISPAHPSAVDPHSLFQHDKSPSMSARLAAAGGGAQRTNSKYSGGGKGELLTPGGGRSRLLGGGAAAAAAAVSWLSSQAPKSARLSLSGGGGSGRIAATDDLIQMGGGRRRNSEQPTDQPPPNLSSEDDDHSDMLRLSAARRYTSRPTSLQQPPEEVQQQENNTETTAEAAAETNSTDKQQEEKSSATVADESSANTSDLSSAAPASLSFVLSSPDSSTTLPPLLPRAPSHAPNSGRLSPPSSGKNFLAKQRSLDRLRPPRLGVNYAGGGGGGGGSAGSHQPKSARGGGEHIGSNLKIGIVPPSLPLPPHLQQPLSARFSIAEALRSAGIGGVGVEPLTAGGGGRRQKQHHLAQPALLFGGSHTPRPAAVTPAPLPIRGRAAGLQGSPPRSGVAGAAAAVGPLNIEAAAQEEQTIVEGQTATGEVGVGGEEGTVIAAPGEEGAVSDSSIIPKKSFLSSLPFLLPVLSLLSSLSPFPSLSSSFFSSSLPPITRVLLPLLVLFQALTLPVRLAFTEHAGESAHTAAQNTTAANFFTLTQRLDIPLDICFIIIVSLTDYVDLSFHPYPSLRLKPALRSQTPRGSNLRLHFLLDLLSSLPYEQFLAFFFPHFLASLWGDDPTLSTPVRITALCRLPRLLRLVRMSKDLDEAETANLVTTLVNPTLFRLLKLAALMFLVAHLAGCGYMLISVCEGLPEGNEFVVPASMRNQPLVTRYLHALHYGFCAMTGSGSGVQSPHTLTEHCFALVVLLLGVSTYATLIGNLSAIISQMNEKQDDFREKINAITDLMNTYHIDGSMQQRVKSCMAYLFMPDTTATRGVVEEDTTAAAAPRVRGEGWQVLDFLPAYLRNDLLCHINGEIIHSVPLFHGCSDGFMRSLVPVLRSEIIIPGDFIIHEGEIGREERKAEEEGGGRGWEEGRGS